MKTVWVRSLSLVLAGVLLCGGAVFAKDKPEGAGRVVRLDIVHVNDIHGHVDPMLDAKVSKESLVGGIPYVRTVVEDCRRENPRGTLVLNAGDLAEGTMLSYLSRGKAICEMLAAFHFDAVALGNHDFAWGQPALEDMLKAMKAQVLTANVRTLEDGGILAGAQAYVLKDVAGLKVGILGLDTPDIRHFVAGEKLKGLDFIESARTVRFYLPLMRKAGAQVIVVLSHVGYEEDLKLAEAVPGIDVIVGGHSHTPVEHGTMVGNTLVVQAGCFGKWVGRVTLDVEQLGAGAVADGSSAVVPGAVRIVRREARLIPVLADKVQPDPEVLRILAPYARECEQVGSEVVTHCEEPVLYAHREAAKLNQVHADSLLAAVRDRGVSFGICNSRSMRGSFKAGDVPYKDLYASLPFTEENYVVMRVKGAAVLAEIEDDLRDKATELAVPMGMKYRYDKRRPEGSRVVELTLNNGETFSPEAEYIIVTNETMSRKAAFSGARDKQVLGPVQPLYFAAIRAGGPWRNDPDDRVVEVSANAK